jgi:PAS domain S-box-containing protein
MTRLHLTSLRSRLLLLVLLTLLPALILILYTNAEQRQSAVLDAQADAVRLVRLVAANEAQLTEVTRQLLLLLAQLPEVRARDPAICSARLAELLGVYPFYALFAVAAPDGDVVCSALPLSEPVNVADRRYFQRALETRDFAIGEHQIGRITGQATINFGYPLLNEENAVEGVVFAALDLAWLNEITAETPLPPGTTLTIIDRQGTILARQPEPGQWVGQTLPEAPLVQTMLAQREGTQELRGLDNVPRLYAFTPLGGGEGDAYVSIGIPAAVAFANANRTLARNLGGLALAATMALAAARLAGSAFILTPVNRLLQATRRLSRGDLSARAGLADDGSEIGQLALAFDEMASALQKRELERQQFLQTLQASEERYRLLVESTQDYAILMLDPAGHVSSWNTGAERIYGYAGGEITGQSFACFYPPEEQARDVPGQDLAKAQAEGHCEHEGWRIRQDGARFWANMSLTPLRDDQDQLRGFSLVTRDITERKRAEEEIRQLNEDLERRVVKRTAQLEAAIQALQQARQEADQARDTAQQANQAKSEFLSRMSHELRTPMNAILGFAQLLHMDALEPEQRTSVKQILKGGRHLLDLINEVLDIARIEAGHYTISPESVHVADALQEAVELVQPLAEQRQVRVATVPEACNRHMLADRQRLKQVLLNLLSNAIKYNRQDGLVTLACEERPGDRLRISVSDTGRGIPAAQIARLFTPFERLGVEQNGVEGTGLGLALSKRLVEAMDGEMGVASTLGEGSTFWLELPRMDAPPEDATVPDSDEETSPEIPAHRARRVLYIEDNPSNLKLIERVLARRPGIQLLTAMQGRLGLDLARQHRPDLILLDLHLPDVAGEEVLRRLWADPATRAVPVVVLSADATKGQIERLRAAGARGYLTKPLDIQHFLTVLDEILQESR